MLKRKGSGFRPKVPKRSCHLGHQTELAANVRAWLKAKHGGDKSHFWLPIAPQETIELWLEITPLPASAAATPVSC